jgi:transposase-like protein
MDLFSQNCPCCDSAEVHAHTRYTTQSNGTRTIHHCRSCDSYFSDTFATAIAGLRTPLSRHWFRWIGVLKAVTNNGYKA